MNINTEPQKYFYIGLFLCGIFFLLQALLFPYWVFPSAGLDQWIYIGYGYNYNAPEFLNWYYKITRAPWLIYQYIWRGLFMLPPVVSAYGLQYSCILAAAFALYTGFYRALGYKKSFLTIVIFFSCTALYASGGQDYHNTPTMPLYTISMVCFFRAFFEKKSDLYFFLFGTFTVLAIYANPIMFLYAAAVAVYYFFFHRKYNRNIKNDLFLFLEAAVAVVLLVGIINKVFFGRNFFSRYEVILKAILDCFLHPKMSTYGPIHWKPFTDIFYRESIYVGYLTGIFVFSVVAICILARKQVKTYFDIIYQFIAITTATFFILSIILHFLGQVSFEMGYVLYPLQISSFMFLACTFISYFNKRNKDMHIVIVTLTSVSVAFLIFYFDSIFFYKITAFIGIDRNCYSSLFYFLIYIAIFSLLFFANRAFILAISLIVLFPASNGGTLIHFNDSKNTKLIYEGVVETHLFLREYGTDTKLAFFYDPKEYHFSESILYINDFPLYVVCTGFKSTVYSDSAFKLIKEDTYNYASDNLVQPVRETPYIAFMSHELDKAQPLVDKFAELGRELELVSEFVIPNSTNEKIWVYH